MDEIIPLRIASRKKLLIVELNCYVQLETFRVGNVTGD